MKTYTKEEITLVIDKLIKEELDKKNKYIQQNGYKHIDTLNKFATRISLLSGLYSKF